MTGFTPSADWQPVDPDEPLPPGIEVRMDLASGQNFARLRPVATTGSPGAFGAPTYTDVPPQANPPDFKLAALEYALKGWAVLPVEPRGKSPLISLVPHGVKNATTDPAQIDRWWTAQPSANIGIACGPSGLVVVDLDVHDGKDGVAEWKKLGITCPTLTVKTGGGGLHLYFSAPPGVHIGNNPLADGIDIRSVNGQVVAPPSIHSSGSSYSLYKDLPIAPLPDEIISRLTAPKEPPDSWELFTLKDAYAPRPPLESVVDGVFYLPSLNIVYSHPGALKSFLIADLAVSVALGRHWLQGKQAAGMKIMQCPALWIDGDNGRLRTHSRFEALARAYNAPPDAPLYYTSMPDPFLDATDRDSLGALAARIVKRGVRLVVIDNLSQICGDADENDASSMRVVLRGLRWLAEYTGAAVIVIHHSRKSGPTGKDGREAETMRGSISIDGAIDLGLKVSRDGVSDNVIVQSTKVRDIVVHPFGAMFVYQHKPGTKELETARFFGTPVVSQSDKAAAELQERVLLTLEGGAMNWSALLLAIGGNKSLLQSALATLTMARQVVLTDGKHGSKIYSLPGRGQVGGQN